MDKKSVAIAVLLVSLLALGVAYFSGNIGKSEGFEGEKAANKEILEVYSKLSPQARALFYQQSEELSKQVPERMVELDELTIGCFGSDRIIQMKADDKNMGGQCCGALMNIEPYEAQLEAIKGFVDEHSEQLGEDAKLIPLDPYDVPVEHAQKLIRMKDEVSLSGEQQAVYEQAVKMSHHGGPCCCRCWKWDMMEGLGKKLMVYHDFSAAELAELWDLSSSCGHAEDVNMYEHYKAES